MSDFKPRCPDCYGETATCGSLYGWEMRECQRCWLVVPYAAMPLLRRLEAIEPPAMDAATRRELEEQHWYRSRTCRLPLAIFRLPWMPAGLFPGKETVEP